MYLFGDAFESRLGHIGIARLAGLTEEQVSTQIEELFALCARTLVAEHARHPSLYRLTDCDFAEGTGDP